MKYFKKGDILLSAFDDIFLDSQEKLDEVIKEEKSYLLLKNYLKNLDWISFLKECQEIPGAIEILKELKDKDILKGFLLQINSIEEGQAKANYIREKDKNKPFNLEEIRHIMKDVVFGLSLLNSLGINHRDIKPDNLVINYKEENRNQDLLKSEIIIIDYGLGIFNNEGKNKKVGTKGYMHPRI